MYCYRFDFEKPTRVRSCQKPLSGRSSHFFFSGGLHHHHYGVPLPSSPPTPASPQISLTANPGRIPLIVLPPSNSGLFWVPSSVALTWSGKVSASGLLPHYLFRFLVHTLSQTSQPFSMLPQEEGGPFSHTKTKVPSLWPSYRLKILTWSVGDWIPSFLLLPASTPLGAHHCSLGHGRNDETKNRTLLKPFPGFTASAAF
ncbi:hypothetical protein LZ30DRAFT_51263 [Colletotrichum cereale]|nr:hypothetical protein LZ30DRAFT_51263 [Colletotrichum cereale]